MNGRLPPEPRFRLVVAAALTAAGCHRAPPIPTATAEATPAPTPPALPAGPHAPEGDDCEGGQYRLPAAGLNPVPVVDGVVVHRTTDRRGGEEAGPQVVRSAGTPCASAADPEACRADLAAPPTGPLVTECGQIGCTRWHLSWTGADGVGRVGNPDELRAWLGEIDTPTEALAVVWASRYHPQCGVTAEDDSWRLSATRRVSDCPMRTDTFELVVTAAGEVRVDGVTEGDPGPCIGRIPPGLHRPGATAGIAGSLARDAHLEAASAHAFRHLHAELRHHGAPAHLLAAVADAVRDEERHAARVGALARGLGGDVPPVVIDATPIRSLAEIARDNAEEGLTRETWGAVVGLWQAEHAGLPAVREVMAEVADDELRHAELSRALHAWLAPQLTAAEGASVDRAQARAWRRIVRRARRPRPEAEALGLPSSAQVAILAATLSAHLSPRATGETGGPPKQLLGRLLQDGRA